MTMKRKKEFPTDLNLRRLNVKSKIMKMAHTMSNIRLILKSKWRSMCFSKMIREIWSLSEDLHTRQISQKKLIQKTT